MYPLQPDQPASTPPPAKPDQLPGKSPVQPGGQTPAALPRYVPPIAPQRPASQTVSPAMTPPGSVSAPASAPATVPPAPAALSPLPPAAPVAPASVPPQSAAYVPGYAADQFFRPRPTVPYQAVPQQLSAAGAPAAIGNPLAKRSHNKLTVILLAALLLVTAGGGAVALWYSRHAASPQALFSGALAGGLHTTSFTQTIRSGSDSSGTIIMDTSNLKNVRMKVRATSKDSQVGSYQVDAYSDKTDAFFKYNTLGSLQSKAQSAGLTGKWIQVQKAGKTVDNSFGNDAGTGLGNFTQPGTFVLGQYLVGNFSSAQQSQLLHTIRTQNVYSPDYANVKHVTVQNRAALMFPTKLNVSQLKKLNQQAANMLGLDPANLDSQLAAISSAQIYVDRQTDRVVKVVATHGSTTSTITYGAYNESNPGAKPSQQLSALDFEDKLAAISTGTNSGGDTASTGSTVDDSDADNERSADIYALQEALEGFYADAGYYPTFDEFNDATWRTNNMPGLDPEALRDPKAASYKLATAPAANVYAYQPLDCQSDADGASDPGCIGYSVSATLSDGSLFSKQNASDPYDVDD